MTRDGMPRAYLRIDPNLDQTHPDIGGFVQLLCAAARQPDRGRFRDRRLLEQILTRGHVRGLFARGDIAELEDGRVYVQGWDEWQEGDHTVADRMKRMRARRNKGRNAPVSPPSPPRDPVTTDAVSTEGTTSSSSASDGEAPKPPPSGGHGLRANGTSPRQLAEKAAAEERELLRRAGLAIHQRYLRGEITALEERQLYDDLRKEPDNLTRLAAS